MNSLSVEALGQIYRPSTPFRGYMRMPFMPTGGPSRMPFSPYGGPSRMPFMQTGAPSQMPYSPYTGYQQMPYPPTDGPVQTPFPPPVEAAPTPTPPPSDAEPSPTPAQQRFISVGRAGRWVRQAVPVQSREESVRNAQRRDQMSEALDTLKQSYLTMSNQKATVTYEDGSTAELPAVTPEAREKLRNEYGFKVKAVQDAYEKGQDIPTDLTLTPPELTYPGQETTPTEGAPPTPAVSGLGEISSGVASLVGYGVLGLIVYGLIKSVKFSRR